MKKLFESLDYRSFLKEHFDELRKEKSWFSYRLIAQKLKIDAGQLVKILQGQRHISERVLPDFISFLGLNQREAEYFTCLVRFNKAKTGGDTRLYFDKLMELKDLTIPRLKPDQDRFYHKWYYSVVRALLEMYPFDGDYKKFGQLLTPAINEAEVRESIELLLELGLISKDDAGILKPTEKFISGGGNWRMLAVRHFQQQTIQLSEQSLVSDPPELRDISSVTISLPKNTLPEFKAMIAEFRKTVLRKVMENEEVPEMVYQLNVQLIPVASTPGNYHRTKL
jgi:uncharacterized protein (TIGR02147 family)